MGLSDEVLARVSVRSGTVCPSEVARALWPQDWRAHMDEVRAAAFALADRGALEVTQGGEVVDGRSARGPIRLRAPHPGDRDRRGDGPGRPEGMA